MKNLFTFIILTLTFSCFSQTQAEMNKRAYAEFHKSDKHLNAIYQTILSEYKSDSIFLENLKKSQRIWIQFRDAEISMKYPEKTNGSIHPTCRAFYLKELTDNRIRNLNIWVSGTEEDTVCNGSLKTIEAIDSHDMEMAYIKDDGSIWLTPTMKKDHRIFGYRLTDIHSEKMILVSIFTNEVEHNPFGCKYGSFYGTHEMKTMQLKYMATENDFLKIKLIKNGMVIDTVYMLKKWFEFEK